jgi:hypothetical protein
MFILVFSEFCHWREELNTPRRVSDLRKRKLWEVHWPNQFPAEAQEQSPENTDVFEAPHELRRSFFN